jgi:hypothetical protein
VAGRLALALTSNGTLGSNGTAGGN